MSARTRATSTTLLVGLCLFLVGCGRQTLPLNTMDPEGPAGREIDRLFDPIMMIAGVVFVLINVGVVYIAVKFRRKSDEEDVFPVQIHGNTSLELGWTILPAVVMAFVAVFTVSTIFKLSTTPDDSELTVCVYGQQWWWSYEYDFDGNCEEEGSTPEIVTASEMVIPAGEPVALKIMSNDVIHSFWIPKLNGKKDAVPGRTHDLWFEADNPGWYLGQCTEFCGLSHSRMRMSVRSLSKADFNTWVADQQKPAPTPAADSSEARGLEVFAGQCATCHQIDGVNGSDCTPGSTCYGSLDPWTGAAQVSGNAPNLTHLMSRCRIAGGIYEIYQDIDGDGEYDCGNEAAFDRAALEAWIRNPPDRKDMAADPTGGNLYGRGMPKLPLTEEQIDDVVDYLATLK